MLKNYCSDKSVVVCHDPGSTDVGEKIRSILLDKESNIEPLTELMLYSASRTELVNKVIIPSLLQNKIVLCDRFYPSTYAYQYSGRGLDYKIVLRIFSMIHVNKTDCHSMGGFCVPINELIF